MLLRKMSMVLLSLGGMALLAGCDTFGTSPAPVASAPPVGRAIDYLNDDLASLVFVVDLPANLQPTPAGTLVTIAASASKGEHHVNARPALVDGDGAAASLTAPEPGRTYYFLGFSDKDKTDIANLQKWARGLPLTDAPVFALSVVPKLCAASPTDPTTAQIAVLAVLPGGVVLAPVIAREPLSAALGASPLTPCAKR